MKEGGVKFLCPRNEPVWRSHELGDQFGQRPHLGVRVLRILKEEKELGTVQHPQILRQLRLNGFVNRVGNDDRVVGSDLAFLTALLDVLRVESKILAFLGEVLQLLVVRFADDGLVDFRRVNTE